MKVVQKLHYSTKKILQKSQLKKLKSLNLRKNGVYGYQCKSLLHLTSKLSSLKLVKYCIEVLKQSPFQRTRQRNTALHYSSKSGHLATTKYLLAYYPKLLNEQNCKRKTALMLSSQYNYPETSLFLLKKGANCNYQDKKGWTVGHWAAFHGQIDVLKNLYNAKFDFSLKNHKQESLLHVSAWNGNIECFDFLSTLIPINQIADKGSIIEYGKGNWQLLLWIFENRLVKIKQYEKILYKIQSPLDIFVLGKLNISTYFVLLYDRDDLLEYLIREKRMDCKKIQLLRNSAVILHKNCKRVIDSALKWDRIKGLLFWFKYKGAAKMTKYVFIELLRFVF